MRQITLTVGRGAVGTPRLLDPERWDDFRESVDALVRRHGYDIVVNSIGTGTWQQADGEVISEQNYHVVGIADAEHDQRWVWPSLERRDNAVRVEVKHLAYVFGQDAIALGFGTSELVEP
jgi:hypothetical protein